MYNGKQIHLKGFCCILSDSAGAMYITDIWESEEDFEDFTHNRMMPGVAKINFNAILPEIEVFPAHSIYSPLIKE